MLVRRDARVLTIRINTDHFSDGLVVKGAWAEDEVWKDLVLMDGEIVKGISFQDDKIAVWYEWSEGLRKDEVVRKALDWARDVVGVLLDEAEEELVGE